MICFLLSLVLHLTSFRAGVVVAEHGNSGNHVYDFFMGRQLNPRVGQVRNADSGGALCLLPFFPSLSSGRYFSDVAN